MSRHEREHGAAAPPASPLPESPPFNEPWQAQAFAMTVALHEGGLFSWTEWAQALSAEVRQPGAAADGHDYYGHWLAALEKLVCAKGMTTKGDIDALSAAWRRAAHATPHGKPILLENDRAPRVQLDAPRTL